MARVKTEKLFLPEGRGWFHLATNFSPKTKKFTCVLPQDVADALERKETLGASTMEEARALWDADCKQAGESKKVVSKVVVVKARLDGTIRRKR